MITGTDNDSDSKGSTGIINLFDNVGDQNLTGNTTGDIPVSTDDDDSIFSNPVQITLLVLGLILLLVLVPLVIFLVILRRTNSELTKEKAQHYVAEKAVLRK